MPAWPRISSMTSSTARRAATPQPLRAPRRLWEPRAAAVAVAGADGQDAARKTSRQPGLGVPRLRGPLAGPRSRVATPAPTLGLIGPPCTATPPTAAASSWTISPATTLHAPSTPRPPPRPGGPFAKDRFPITLADGTVPSPNQVTVTIRHSGDGDGVA